MALAGTRSAINLVPGPNATYGATYTVTAAGGTDSQAPNAPASAQGAINVGAYTELAIDVFLSQITGTSITFLVDRQGTDGRWYNLTTGTALNAASTNSSATAAVVGGTSFSIGMGGPTTINASTGSAIRVRWTVVSFTTATFTISVIGK